MIFYQKEFSIANPDLTQIAREACASYTETLGKHATDTMPLELQLEEVLLRFRHANTSDTPCVLKGRKMLSSVSFGMSKQDRQINPLEIDESMQGICDILGSFA